MQYVGMDVHERSSAVCILDQDGRVVKRHEVRGHPRRAVEWLGELDEPFRVCFEASTNYGWLHDRLRGIAAQVVVAHPGRLRLIFRSRRKNDRIDAERLAKLLYLDEVPTVHVPTPETRGWRGLIEHRRRSVAARTRSKNTIRALLRTHGIEVPRKLGLWSKQGQAWLGRLDLPDEMAALRRDQLVSDLVYQDEKIGRIERTLERISRRHPAVIVLMTIPGVGIRTAEAFAAYIDDPNRFRRSKAIGAYLGLVPSQDASAGMNHLGRITKEGPAVVRQMLAEAAWQAVRRSSTVRTFFERVMRSEPSRRKTALVATAHYLARVMLRMLKTGEAWRESEPSVT